MDVERYVSECIVKTIDNYHFPPLGDFHTSNATAFYGLENTEKAYKNDYPFFKNVLRDNSKRVGLALCYGGSYKTIQKGIGCSESEARELYSKFFSTLRGFKKHIEVSEKKAYKEGYTRNLFGTKLYLKELQSSDYKVKAAGIRHLQNYPIQSIAANLIQLILLKYMNLVEETETSIFAGNNIHENYYNRVFYTSLSKKDSIEKELENFDTGNILVVLTDNNNEIVESFDRPLALRQGDIERLELKDYLEYVLESYTRSGK